jgi:hypothetical protein
LKNQSQFKEDFSSYLECKPEVRELDNYFNNISTTHFQLFKLIFGLFLSISAILMLTQMVLFGPMVWWIALMYGLMLIVKSVFFDIGKKNGDNFQYNSEKSIFLSKRVLKGKFQYITAKNIKSILVKKWFRKLDFFDLFGFILLLIFTILQQMHGWNTADTLDLVIINSTSTFFIVILNIFILFYLCFPIDVIEFSTGTVNFRLEITLNQEKKGFIAKYIGNLTLGIKELKNPEMRKILILRLAIYFGVVFGAIIYMIIYFFTIY